MGISDLMISSPRYELSTSDYNEACRHDDDDDDYKEKEEYFRKRDEYFKNIETKIKQFEKEIYGLPFEKIPIKYTKNKVKNNTLFLVYWHGCSGTGYDFTKLFKVQKIKNRFYCCKNCVDLWNKIIVL